MGAWLSCRFLSPLVRFLVADDSFVRRVPPDLYGDARPGPPQSRDVLSGLDGVFVLWGLAGSMYKKSMFCSVDSSLSHLLQYTRIRELIELLPPTCTFIADRYSFSNADVRTCSVRNLEGQLSRPLKAIVPHASPVRSHYCHPLIFFAAIA